MKLTDTQLVLLSAASQRDDRGLELAPNLKGGAAQKLVRKLLAEGLIDEVGACASRKSYPRVAMMQPGQNRHSGNSPMSLDRSTERSILAQR
jgi:hypothetical protein